MASLSGLHSWGVGVSVAPRLWAPRAKRPHFRAETPGSRRGEPGSLRGRNQLRWGLLSAAFPKPSAEGFEGLRLSGPPRRVSERGPSTAGSGGRGTAREGRGPPPAPGSRRKVPSPETKRGQVLPRPSIVVSLRSDPKRAPFESFPG